MADNLFFKQISPTQWLGLRLPVGLALTVDDKGVPSEPSSVIYDPATTLPDGIASISVLALQRGAQGPELMTKVIAAPAPLPAPLDNLLKAADEGAILNEALKAEMARLSSAASLPLLLYWEYRNAPVGPDAHDAQTYLSMLYGNADTKVRLESLSQLLFIATCAAGQHPVPAPGVFVDVLQPSELAPNGMTTQAKPLTLGVVQVAQGVVVQLKDGALTVTNNSILGTICPGDEQLRTLGCSYEWTRTLGLAARSAARSGAIFIAPLKLEVGPLPFSIVDQLKPDELVGELLNYDVQLFNPHGRCTHQGRIIIKRQRLDRPAPPVNPRVVLQRPPKNAGAQLACTLSFALTDAMIKEMLRHARFKLVVYRSDFPVVPTGFFGDADDQSLLVARRMADLDTAFDSQADYSGDITVAQAGAADINLSNHNLKLVDAYDVVLQSETGEPPTRLPRQIQMDIDFDVATATQFFVAIRRDVDVGDGGAQLAAPESSVTPVEHWLTLAGSIVSDLNTNAADLERQVPHLEAYWLASDTAHALLGDGLARVLEITRPIGAGYGETPPQVTVQVQHKRRDSGSNALIGGYRLWVRELLAAGARDAFVPVALVQALPPLVKEYAPLESGRKWLRVKPALAGVAGGIRLQPAKLTPPDFIDAGTAISAGVPGSTRDALAELANNTREELKARSMDPDSFNKGVAQAGEALDSAATDANKLFAMLSRHDEPGQDDEHTLRAVLGLRQAGLAREIILSVRKRQRLQQGQMQMQHFEGHWLFFQDQNDVFLGRAFHFWAPATLDPATVPLVQRFYILREASAPHDAIGMDDFGRVAWSWDGIRDCWRHELEWLIEPIGRYVPLLGKRASLDTDALVPAATADQVHRLSIQRSAPLQARFSLVQAFAPQTDEFLVRMIAPADFRQALHNTVARTRLGVLRVVPEITSRVLTDQDAFARDSLDVFDAFVKHQATEPDTMAPQLAQTALLGEPGTYGELRIDEPPCIKLSVSVHARADAVRAQATSIESMERPAFALQVPATGVPRIFPSGRGREIRIPLARLRWTYTGQRKPAIGAYIQEAGNDKLSLFKLRFGQDALLALPDPYAELTLYLQHGGLSRPVLVFQGPSTRLTMPASIPGLVAAAIDWGNAMHDPDPNIITALGMRLTDLVLTVPDRPGKYFYQWRIQGKSTVIEQVKEAK